MIGEGSSPLTSLINTHGLENLKTESKLTEPGKKNQTSGSGTDHGGC